MGITVEIKVNYLIGDLVDELVGNPAGFISRVAKHGKASHVERKISALLQFFGYAIRLVLHYILFSAALTRVSL